MDWSFWRLWKVLFNFNKHGYLKKNRYTILSQDVCMAIHCIFQDSLGINAIKCFFRFLSLLLWTVISGRWFLGADDKMRILRSQLLVTRVQKTFEVDLTHLRSSNDPVSPSFQTFVPIWQSSLKFRVDVRFGAKIQFLRKNVRLVR